MISSGCKCDRCLSWICNGFEFGHINTIVNNEIQLLKDAAGRTPKDDPKKHYCRNCAFEELFPEKIEHPKRGGPGDW